MDIFYEFVSSFISRILMPVGFFLCAFSLPKRENYRKRMAAAWCILIAAALCFSTIHIVEIFALEITEMWILISGDAVLMTLMFIAAIFLFRRCYERTGRVYLYIVAAFPLIWFTAMQCGYLIEEVISAISVPAGEFLEEQVWLKLLIELLPYALFYLLFFQVCRKVFGRAADVKIDKGIIIISTSLIGIVLISNTLVMLFVDIGLVGYIIVVAMYVLFSLGILLLQFYNIYAAHRLYESETIRRLQEEQHKQTMIAKETIDIINIKCHDLKHAIYAGKGIGSSEAEQAITIYDTLAHTGNEILDVLLTDKGLQCKAKNIDLEALVDGTLISFMREEDVCSFFGNALENAIEYLTALPDEGQKYISIRIVKASGCVSVTVENYFEGETRATREGLFRTSKGDEVNHGFGLRSMKYTVEKYGGTFLVKSEGKRFLLTAAFPFQNN